MLLPLSILEKSQSSPIFGRSAIVSNFGIGQGWIKVGRKSTKTHSVLLRTKPAHRRCFLLSNKFRHTKLRCNRGILLSLGMMLALCFSAFGLPQADSRAQDGASGSV